MAKELNPKVILAVGAHPDDIEYCFGGSIAKWVSEGVEVHYLICTDGSRGSADETLSPDQIKEVRKAEQQKAADVLGVKSVDYLDFEDCKLTCNDKLKEAIVKSIRTIKPDTVLSFDPTFFYCEQMDYVNHSDHRAVGEATMDSVYPLARDKLSFPGQEPHKVKNLVMFNLDTNNIIIYVEDTMDKKIQAMCCFESQFEDLKMMEEVVKRQARFCAGDDEKLAESFVLLQP